MNPQASVAGLKGPGSTGGKAARAGLFARLMASFQAQIRQGPTSSSLLSQVGAKGVVGKAEGVESITAAKKLALGAASEARASSMIPSRWNRADLSDADAAASTMEMLITANAAKMKSNKDLKDELFSQFKADQAQQAGKKSSTRPASEEIVVAGLGEPLMLQSQKNSGVRTSNILKQETSDDSKGKQLLNAFKGGDELSGAEKNPDAGKTAATEKGVQASRQSESQAVSKTVVEEMTADDWLAANIRKSTAMESTGKAARTAAGEASLGTERTTADKTSRSVELASKGEVGIDAGKVAATKAEGAKQAQGVQVESADLPEGELQDKQRSKANLQRANIHASERARVHQEGNRDQAEPVANIAAQAKGRSASIFQQAHISQVQAGSTEKLTAQSSEFSGSTSQQDMNSGSHQSDPLLADHSKADSKGARGADFASQMHYKSAHVYKPAEAMIEIARSAKDGAMKLEMQLEPAHLGKVHVTLQSDAGKQLQIHIHVDQAASRQVIEQHLPQLRTALAEQGLDLGHFSMNMNSQGGQDGTGQSERDAFGEFALNTRVVEGSQEPITRLGINTAGGGHLSILA